MSFGGSYAACQGRDTELSIRSYRTKHCCLFSRQKRLCLLSFLARSFAPTLTTPRAFSYSRCFYCPVDPTPREQSTRSPSASERPIPPRSPYPCPCPRPRQPRPRRRPITTTPSHDRPQTYGIPRPTDTSSQTSSPSSRTSSISKTTALRWRCSSATPSPSRGRRPISQGCLGRQEATEGLILVGEHWHVGPERRGVDTATVMRGRGRKRQRQRRSSSHPQTRTRRRWTCPSPAPRPTQGACSSAPSACRSGLITRATIPGS